MLAVTVYGKVTAAVPVSCRDQRAKVKPARVMAAGSATVPPEVTVCSAGAGVPPFATKVTVNDAAGTGVHWANMVTGPVIWVVAKLNSEPPVAVVHQPLKVKPVRVGS